ncbi:MAG: T9SS type A sorting domain-containing protein, partial [bacterium]
SASDGGESMGDVYAFPNPVKDGYDGYIGIKGLVSNAQVRITDVNGALVYSTRAEGGQAIWNGRNFSGKKARTGVYLVFASDDKGNEKVVTKILIVN